ncbi:MAG TPA: hypothetical protein VJB96_04960 [Patescibacteria group bacterium]|nr:hypothetical protein [Patescibacteria group bacterium]
MESLLSKIDRSRALSQFVPIALTGVVMAGFLSLLHGAIVLFNLIPSSEKIFLEIRWTDVLVGATIYLKTSIDFAIFIGRMMAANPGWRSRVAIEIGTAAGNTIGTIAIIGLWVTLKEVDILLALMVFIASLVLFELAHGSMEHFANWGGQRGVKRLAFDGMHAILDRVKKVIDPVLSRVMPDLGKTMKGKASLPWKSLIVFSASVPFILGLDDFAGYVPLFNVVNVYGFAIGVIVSHTILNIALFLSPKKTITAVKNEVVSFLGALAFIGLGVYGLVETVKIVLHAL